MKALLDTNVVVRHLNRNDSAYDRVSRYLGRLADQGFDLVVAPQVLFELWVIATRPADVNGLGLNPRQAEQMVRGAMSSFGFLPDPVDLVSAWLDLCVQSAARGRHAHDVRLAAWMKVHEVTHLVTLNPAHFATLGTISLCIPP